MKKKVKSELGVKAEKDDFSEWFSEAIVKAGLVDYSPVSGCMILRPWAYSIWETIVAETDKRLKKLGIENVYFPLFIPESLLKKEVEHLKGFSPEVAWVTEVGQTKLQERLAIRPTSEAVMYSSFAKWIRSWRDLPIKFNQWNNVVRWEFKHPIPLLRTREFLWNEGHTVYATEKEALAEEKQILGIYNEIMQEWLAVAGFVSRKTETDKFAGAVFTKAIECLLPNGRVVQGPDFHYDGQKFAKAFDIMFLDKDGKKKYVWQNTWALTTRVIGIMLAIHGDNKGLIIPPKVAPVQAVIVPIFSTKDKEKVMKKAEDAKKKVKVRVLLDDREGFSPGFKFNDWEMRGVPVRIEIGPKDIKKNQVVVVRRDSGKKESVKVKSLAKEISKTLEDIQNSLLKKSEEMLKKATVQAKNMDEVIKGLKNKKIVVAVWCGDPKCEQFIKEKTNAKIIGINEKVKAKGNCVCGKCKGTGYVVWIAKSY